MTENEIYKDELWNHETVNKSSGSGPSTTNHADHHPPGMVTATLPFPLGPETDTLISILQMIREAFLLEHTHFPFAEQRRL